MEKFSFLNAANIDYIADLYDKYLISPDAIEPSWRSFFQGYDLANENYSFSNSSKKIEIPESVHKEFKVIDLIDGYRTRGHLFTKTNPIRQRRNYLPTLDIENFGLCESDLKIKFKAGEIIGIGTATLEEIITYLQRIYCKTIGIEYMYLRNPKEIKWWQDILNKNQNQPTYDEDTKKYILSKLNHAVTFEEFLQVKYVGQKRFSLEGAESMIPALSMAIRNAAEIYDVDDFVLGMAHRGRLNTLTNIFRKPVRNVFNEFEGKDFNDEEIDGDVKYHLGLTIDKTLKNKKTIRMNLVPNPSHLEAVAPVAQGISRAKADVQYKGNKAKVLPIVIHGDSAIAGQGVVYEVIQMSQLEGYSTGGTVHIVINNQLGFTTNYSDARSSTYCTDIAKITLSPVLHVNADDVEAVVHATEMALKFRMKFGKDVFIDLLGYRKYGHNEGDEPRFTQPKLYKAISKHPSVVDLYAKQLISENVINESYFKNLNEDFKKTLEKEYIASKTDKKSEIKSFMQQTWEGFNLSNLKSMLSLENTTYNADKLKGIAKVISTVPKGNNFIKKVERILKERAKMVFQDNTLDWGLAETLAYGSLLQEGYNVRISGQDVERGTFSHRHAVLIDELTEERVILLNRIENIKGRMYAYNSILSEYGILGFEYGYAMANPNTLTIWEAQFGDFSNGAQIMFDQYISASEDKWKLQNGIVVFLPHGYEGQGAEHSCARMERYLQLCAIDNMTVADCTTPSNFFHLIRRHMKRKFRKPLIVMTPKSLLRHPLAVSKLEDLAKGRFQEVIDDTIEPKRIKRLVFCTGKFYYDLLQERTRLNDNATALVRIEQLFPLHKDRLKKVINRYTNVTDYVWAQEEPENMGAWSYILQRFQLVPLRVASRPFKAATAAGSSTRFKQRHKAVINKVFNKKNNNTQPLKT